MALWRFEFLGGLRVVGEDQVLTHFESRKTAALLAYLALHPERPHPREELAALIWPDAEFESSRNRLKQSLASLRKLLSGEVFVADRFAVRVISGAIETDVAQWEQLVRAGRRREAKELWRGELLPGFYDEVLITERERLNALKESLCPDDEAVPSVRQVRLPAPPTRFLGREVERARLAELLTTERWITVTGPGGMGKTRLAIEAARDWGQGDVAFVELAALTLAEGVLMVIAEAVEFPLTTAKSPLDTLCGYLKDYPTLLLLDNAEDLEPGELATLCQQLLTRLPELRLLVTSRQLLDGFGEVRFPLEALTATEGGRDLFLDRARCARPDFPDTDDIRVLCELLEGMPLAIELCAAWAGALSAPQMRERLERGEFSRLQTRRSVSGEERHRSVEAAFLSSYERLAPARQLLLRGLTVFRGSWTLEAAEAVCPTNDTLGDLLALSDASLIGSCGPERFTLLESLRRCIVSILDPKEQVALDDAHFHWCRTFSDPLATEAEHDYLVRCDSEMSNLRQALERGFTWEKRSEGAELLLKLQLFLNLRGYNAEVTDWLERALASTGLSDSLRVELMVHLGATQLEQRDQLHAEKHLSDALILAQNTQQEGLEALALYHLGRFAELQRLPELARERHEQALLLRRYLGDAAGIARSCNLLASLMIQRGALDPAGPLLIEAEEMARAAGRESVLADVLYQRAHLTMMSGDTPGALALLVECQETARRLGLRSLLARVTHSLGCTAQELGDELRARAAFLEAARTFHLLRAKLGTHFPLWYLARLYSSWEEWDIVLLTMGSAIQLWEDLARPLAPEDQELLKTLRAQAEHALGSQRAEHFWQQGRSLPVEEILARVEARQPLKYPRRPDSFSPV